MVKFPVALFLHQPTKLLLILKKAVPLRSLSSFNYLIHRSYSQSLIGVNDFEDELKNFKLEVPDKFNFAKDVMDKWPIKQGTSECNETGLWWIDDHGKEVKWSFAQLSQFSKRIANVLEGPCQLKKGDIIIVLLRGPEWWLFTLGSIRSGVVMSPGTMLLTNRDISYRLNASKAKVIVTDDTLSPEVDKVSDECPDLQHKIIVSDKPRSGWMKYQDLFDSASEEHQCAETNSSDPMALYFTSGTTGAPKMTVHSQASYGLGHMITARYWYDGHPSDVLWGLSDPGWAKAGYCAVFAPWLVGSCSFVHAAAGKFDAKRTLEILKDYPVTTFCAPPTAFRMFVKEDLKSYKFKALRHCCSAGEPLNPEVSETWLKGTGHHIHEGYGQTETTIVACTPRCIDVKPGSMGKAAPTLDVAIIDEDGHELPTNTEGDIAIKIKPNKPVGLCQGYLNDEERTSAAIRGDYWVLGDRGMVDEEGYFWFIGRSDDVIISSGYRIGPFEVESALIEHDAVLESAVVSSPDPERGEIVKAFVILTPQYVNHENKESLKKDLQQHVKKTTAPYKYPRKIEFVEELPKTISGKIRRVELRQNEWKQHSSK